ncbi:hypothetical protein AK812_SmicGene27409 [Symbiodinium microadriaticum]|uniref:EF-hand domain-containing protein n=1 Tax=Symbiodinium microadriaticum TaxID=2951 RepID=A0A1Q9D703_SYMMI|nr:hypothetical protein AK812_SmicGene27409 [Symbiodinium microadriaticum]
MYGSPSTGAASPKPPVPSGALDGSHKSTLCAWGYQYSELFGDLFYDLAVERGLAMNAVSGGNDWYQYAEVLHGISSTAQVIVRLADNRDLVELGNFPMPGMGDFYFLMFNFYIAFCVVGLFNVVTGVFVAIEGDFSCTLKRLQGISVTSKDSAVCTRTEDEIVQADVELKLGRLFVLGSEPAQPDSPNRMSGYLDEMRSMTESIKGFLKKADKDASGTLTYEEFQAHMANPVKAYFSGLDIDPDETKIIFTLLDSDCNGDIDIEATKLDIMALMYDTTQKQSMRFEALCDFLESTSAQEGQISDIVEALPVEQTDSRYHVRNPVAYGFRISYTDLACFVCINASFSEIVIWFKEMPSADTLAVPTKQKMRQSAEPPKPDVLRQPQLLEPPHAMLPSAVASPGPVHSRPLCEARIQHRALRRFPAARITPLWLCPACFALRRPERARGQGCRAVAVDVEEPTEAERLAEAFAQQLGAAERGSSDSAGVQRAKEEALEDAAQLQQLLWRKAHPERAKEYAEAAASGEKRLFEFEDQGTVNALLNAFVRDVRVKAQSIDREVPPGVESKVVHLLRHGQGFHNMLEGFEGMEGIVSPETTQVEVVDGKRWFICESFDKLFRSEHGPRTVVGLQLYGAISCRIATSRDYGATWATVPQATIAASGTTRRIMFQKPVACTHVGVQPDRQVDSLEYDLLVPALARHELLDPSLTALGRGEALAANRDAVQQQLSPRLIVVSPITRATQTAFLAFQHLLMDNGILCMASFSRDENE